ncbi:MAG TPA: PDZ domain-containing protein [Terriglobia bacterium]|nr:PDZ domain-containing protein [Terriglobia bacterium]
MTTKTIWPRAAFLIALSVLTACVAAFAASGKQDQPTQTYNHLRSLLNPGHESWLGLIVTDTNEATAKELKLPHITGAIVTSVVDGSPAEKAGFQKNDVIMEFDGQRVRSAAQLQRLIEETPPDRTVSVQISRQGRLQTLEAKIGTRGPSALLETPESPNYKLWTGPELQEPQTPEPFVEPMPKGKIIPVPPVIPKFHFYLGPLPNHNPQPPSEVEPFIEPGPKGEMPSPSKPFSNPFLAPENSLGISGDDLTPQLARYFGVVQGKGVLVSRVDPSSPASAAGLRAGDVIVRVGSQQVGSMAELEWALQSQANQQHKVTLAIVRDHHEQEMSILLTPRSNDIRPEPIMARRVQQW